jgi:hypothetical protein
MNNVQTLSPELIEIIKNHLNSLSGLVRLHLLVDNNPNVICEFINKAYLIEGPHSIMQYKFINRNTSIFNVINVLSREIPPTGMAYFGDYTIIYNIPNRKEVIIMPTLRFQMVDEHELKYTDKYIDEYLDDFDDMTSPGSLGKIRQVESRAIRRSSHLPIFKPERPIHIYAHKSSDVGTGKTGYSRSKRSISPPKRNIHTQPDNVKLWNEQVLRKKKQKELWILIMMMLLESFFI